MLMPSVNKIQMSNSIYISNRLATVPSFVVSGMFLDVHTFASYLESCFHCCVFNFPFSKCLIPNKMLRKIVSNHFHVHQSFILFVCLYWCVNLYLNFWQTNRFDLMFVHSFIQIISNIVNILGMSLNTFYYMLRCPN